MKVNKLYLGLGTALITALAIVAIAVSTSGPKPISVKATQAAVATNAVTIKNYMFSPMVIKVKVGSKVTWTNQDSVSHTVMADTVSRDAPASMDISHGQTYSFTFNKTGTYAYHCFPHPYMHGTVEVTN